MLTSEGVPIEKQRLFFSADIRYVGQYHEVSVPLIESDLVNVDTDALAARFHLRHDQLYGYAVDTAPLELVTLRLTAIGETEKPRLPTTARQSEDSQGALKGKRRAYLPDRHDFAALPVYDGDALMYGNRIEGPALIEQATTTVFVPTEYDMLCDALGSFVLYLKGRTEEIEEKLKETATAVA